MTHCYNRLSQKEKKFYNQIVFPFIRSKTRYTYPETISAKNRLLRSKKIKFLKDKVILIIKNRDNILLDKKINSESLIKKFIVQLGVFKNKKNADKQLLIINKHKILQFNEVEIKLVKTKKENNLLYTIETNTITKIKAINMCDFFKNKKINCIIKIRK